jgi:hypothetical protein
MISFSSSPSLSPLTPYSNRLTGQSPFHFRARYPHYFPHHFVLVVSVESVETVEAIESFGVHPNLTLHFRVIGLEMSKTFIRQSKFPAPDVLNQNF